VGSVLRCYDLPLLRGCVIMIYADPGSSRDQRWVSGISKVHCLISFCDHRTS
jgi:hypothetical protein